MTSTDGGGRQDYPRDQYTLFGRPGGHTHPATHPQWMTFPNTIDCPVCKAQRERGRRMRAVQGADLAALMREIPQGRDHG